MPHGPDSGARPLASVLFLAFNQERTVRGAVASILAQAGPPIDIILSDDASTDGTFEAMTEAVRGYAGPHQIRLRRNTANVGIGEHLNQLVAESRGELLFIAAGDDESEPHRVETVVLAWQAGGCRADLVASHLTDMDTEGGLHGVLPVDDLARWRTAADWVVRRPYVVGAGHAWTRRVFDHFGPFEPGTAYEDQVMAFRALASGGAFTVPEPLVRYRRGGVSARGQTPSAESRLRRMAVQNKRHLSEIRQLMKDAARTDWAPHVTAPLTREWQKQAYVAHLMAADGPVALVRTFLGPHKVPSGWRVRKFWAALRGRAWRLGSVKLPPGERGDNHRPT